MNFAAQVKETMTALGVNQKWLAEHSGLQQATVSRMLRGGGNIGTVAAWVAMAEALGCEWKLQISEDR